MIIVLSVTGFLKQAGAEIVINEVMSNEPGSQVSLEWVELYNDSDSAKYLAFYTLEIGGTVFNFPGETIGGYQYLAVCRRLATLGTTAGFESVWGNNSGIWGDAPSESYKLYQLTGMSLGNDSGTAVLKYSGIVKSTFRWTSAGADGVSWERFTPASPAISNCIDPRGGTPGRINSITPGNADLALLALEAMPLDSGYTLILLEAANAGLTYMANNTASLYYDLNRDSAVTNADLIEILDLPAMSPNDTFEVELIVQLEGTYPSILAKLPADDRLTNNVRIATVPGKRFPPVIISEFMADPQAPLGTEWVEIKNISDSMIDLQGWLLGDSMSLHPMADWYYILDTGQYHILVKDSAAFRSFYSNADIPVHELAGWSTLNNDCDAVRLVDNFGYTVDSCTYNSVFGDNYTWARGEATRYGRWGRSKEPGGSPGSANDVFYPAQAGAIRVTAEPNPFSLTKDEGINISYVLPPGASFTMKVYDVEGRAVKTMMDNAPALEGDIVWDGRSDGGRSVAPGIYILYLEVFGKEEYKQTIVAAP